MLLWSYKIQVNYIHKSIYLTNTILYFLISKFYANFNVLLSVHANNCNSHIRFADAWLCSTQPRYFNHLLEARKFVLTLYGVSQFCNRNITETLSVTNSQLMIYFFYHIYIEWSFLPIKITANIASTTALSSCPV